MSEAKGGPMGAEGGAQMKAMGMGRTLIISRPDKQATYMIYPDIQAYLETPVEQDGENGSKNNEFKLQVTELGKETIDGQPTTKNRVIVTDDKGQSFEATVWNAKDLKNFPLKIQHSQQEVQGTISYKNVKLSKPEPSLFDPPKGFKKYPSMQELMQQEIMKRMGLPGGIPSGATPMPPGK
jgi:hypothetical protein